MPLLHLILMLALPVLLLLSAGCSAAETALFSLTQADRLRLRKTHPRVHAIAARVLDEPRALLISILLANTAVNAAFMISASMLGAALEPAGQAAVGVGSVLAIILFGEVIPKSIAAAHRVTVCRVVARPVELWTDLTGGLVGFVEHFVVAPLARVFAPAEREPEPLTTGDLSALLELGARQGVLHADERRLLHDVVHLSDLRVREVMTPRVDVEWLEEGATGADLLALVRETGHSRFPLCRGGFEGGKVVGIASAQGVLRELHGGAPAAGVGLSGTIDPAAYIPERARLDQLLEHFRRSHSDAAVCVSELGDVTGLVVLDDVVGVLASPAEASHEAIEDQVRAVGPGRWQVSGRLSVRDWSQFFGRRSFEIPARVATVAGLILARLGKVPRVGDEVVIGDLTLRVEQMTGRVIEWVGVSLASAQEAPA